MKKLFTVSILMFGLILAGSAQKNKTSSTPAAQALAADVFQGVKWRNIGPFRGGRANAIAGVIQDPNVYYVGYTGGGVSKTEDGGTTWKNISDGFFTVGSIGKITVSESDPNVVYVGSGEHAVRGVMTSFGDGMYKSTDAGASWKKIGLEKSRHIADIAVHPANPDIVLVAAQGAVHGASADRGIYKSVDGGATWKRTLYADENTGPSAVVMDMTNPRTIYAAMWQHRRYPWKVESGPNSSVWKSTDMGETWTKIVEGLPKEMGKIGLSVSRVNPNRVFALVEAEKSKAGMYRSDDGGKKWTLVSNDPLITARSWYYMEVYADPVNPEVVYALNAPMMRSVDGGKTFENMGLVHGDTHDLWINPKNNKNIALADDGGGSITYTYGKSWSSLNNQATAQFYRVNADNRRPYWVASGQQDNLSVVIPSRTNDYGILSRHWFNGPGCESAYIVYDDPSNPVVLYGGCYQGQISAQDTRTMEMKDIMEYPASNEGRMPKAMKYRFNWNAPLINSPHDSKTMYHAGNVLFKTTNGGLRWDVISPDLTRNDTTKQNKSGGPITNEGAGGENYNTIYYVIESSLEQGVIYTGSDCGLVHVTRDGGKSWQNITPQGLPEAMIHSIEVSPHDKGTVYISANRYKFNDFSNMTYKSEDYGKTWTKIGTGVRPDDFIKVIREDVKAKGILYAGAERGFYISFNGGATFQQIQSNLPVVPVTDLIIRDNDLVAATAGRSFWVLDDLSVFQQSKGNFSGFSSKLYQPKTSYRIFGPGGFFLITEPAVGQNPPEGTTLDYFLKEEADTNTLKLEILDARGTVIRKYTNRKDDSQMTFKPFNGGPPPAPVLSASAGVNRFTWDWRTEFLPNIGIFVNGADYRGHRVAPGKYKARLTYKRETSEVEIELLSDPKVNIPDSEWTRQQQFLESAENGIREVHGGINEFRKVKRQVESFNEAYKGHDEEIIKLGKELSKKLDEWESKVVESRQKSFQDVLNWPNKLNAEFFRLRNGTDVHDPRVPKGFQDRLSDLQQEWTQYKKEMQQIIDVDIQHYNKSVKEKNLPAIMLDKKEVIINN